MTVVTSNLRPYKMRNLPQLSDSLVPFLSQEHQAIQNSIGQCVTSLQQIGPDLNTADANIATNTAAITALQAALNVVGNYAHSQLAPASALTLTSGTPVNITSISLPPGDWDVYGAIANNPASATVTTVLTASIGTVSATAGGIGVPGRSDSAFGSNTGGNVTLVNVLPIRMLLASTTTIFLVADSFFSGGAMTAYGYISARRWS